jgi:hypothetical protein
MKRILAMALFIALGGAQIAVAHHPFSSEFDLKKPMTLKGTVTRYSWVNPHATIDLTAVEGRAQDETWTVELDAAAELGRIGWDKTSVKPGDRISAQGWAAKDGSHMLGASSVSLADGKTLAATSTFYEANKQGNEQWKAGAGHNPAK